ncbi:MAG: hypothetical protein V8S33_10005 [Intestinibacter bartlettii]
MTVNMKLVPNPADGLAQAVGDLLNKGLGFGKNTIDYFQSLQHVALGYYLLAMSLQLGLGL